MANYPTAIQAPTFYCPICGRPCGETTDRYKTVFVERTFNCRPCGVNYEVMTFMRHKKLTSEITATRDE